MKTPEERREREAETRKLYAETVANEVVRQLRDRDVIPKEIAKDLAEAYSQGWSHVSWIGHSQYPLRVITDFYPTGSISIVVEAPSGQVIWNTILRGAT